MDSTNDLAALIERSSELTWLADAACADLDIDQLDLFFVEAGKTLSKDAIAICGSCPVRVACLTHAYDNEIAGGYYGGVSPTQRRKLDLADAIARIQAPA
ncbi:WhiB family transcriptional regulator [Ilumatobacter sp.]|uniref:WhiB family transcriptional regulator n=1 Tax=Ilumatobacter sp. TaxID=1967498 RepID=UPI003B51D08B